MPEVKTNLALPWRTNGPESRPSPPNASEAWHTRCESWPGSFARRPAPSCTSSQRRGTSASSRCCPCSWTWRWWRVRPSCGPAASWPLRWVGWPTRWVKEAQNYFLFIQCSNPSLGQSSSRNNWNNLSIWKVSTLSKWLHLNNWVLQIESIQLRITQLSSKK